MKVAITSVGQDLNSQVDPRFGRAKYLIVVDLETDELVVYANAQNADAVHGAGIQAGRAVVDLGASALLTGHVGPKAFATLETVATNLARVVARRGRRVAYLDCDVDVTLRERAPKRSFGRRLKDLLYAKRILRSPKLPQNDTVCVQVMH